MTNKFSLIFTLCFALFLTSCTKQDDGEFANYVQEPVKSNVKDLDPTVSSDLYSSIIMGHIFSNLVQYHYLKLPMRIIPLDAEAMPTISADKKTYTFKLRKGLMFHDSEAFKATGGKGREVTAEDYLYSWKRAADPSTHSDGFWIFEGKVKGFKEWRDEAAKVGKADYSKPVPGLSAPDKYTIKITLEKPYPQLLYVLAMNPAAVVPREAVEFYGQEFQNHPVGSGPYKFRSWVRNSKIILDKNPNYRKDDLYPADGDPDDKAAGRLADAGKSLPLNDGIVFHEVVEDQPRWLNYMKGAFDWVEIPKDNQDGAVKNGKVSENITALGMNLSTTVDNDVTFDSFNMEDPVVGGAKGKLLRQALSLAVDPNELIKKFYDGRAVSAQGPVPPSSSGFDPSLKNPYKGPNIEKAKELLKKAGHPNGEGLPELVYDVYSGSTARQLAEFFQQRAALIGVKVRINVNTWPEFIQKQKIKKIQVFGMAWQADYPDGENFLQLFYGPNKSPGPNNSNYDNPEFNKLYEQASVLFDGPARNAIYRKMMDILVDDIPWVFNVHRKSYVLTQGWFKNYKRNLTIQNYGKYYRIDAAAKAELKKKL